MLHGNIHYDTALSDTIPYICTVIYTCYDTAFLSDTISGKGTKFSDSMQCTKWLLMAD